MRFKYKLVSSRERLRQKVFTIWIVLEGYKCGVLHAEVTLFSWRSSAGTGFRGPCAASGRQEQEAVEKVQQLVLLGTE